jgi:hypothetical protein
LVQGGGSICASLDVAGAPIAVEDPNAGTLTPKTPVLCFGNSPLVLEALAGGNSNVPAGYQTIYVLTSGSGLVIEQVNAIPSFTVTTPGLYTIHTLVYNPATLDLTIVVPGQTTGFDVNGLLVQGGGSICASLDVAGAQFSTTLMQELLLLLHPLYVLQEPEFKFLQHLMEIQMFLPDIKQFMY